MHEADRPVVERVEFFPRAGGHLPPTLEKAALGSYEVVNCTLVHDDLGPALVIIVVN